MLFCVLFFAGIVGRAAVTNYVVPPGTAGVNPAPNYTNWATAATNIQDAINVAGNGAGNAIFITNGHYYLTGALSVAKTVLIRSFNNGVVDPTNTIVDANNYTGKHVTNQCVSIVASATVEGLTFTNGVATSLANGGGCYLYAGTITNCIITGNSATNGFFSGGGIYTDGGGGVVANCQIVANLCTKNGAGISIRSGIIVKNCFFGWNQIVGENGNGAISFDSAGYVYNCDIVSNSGLVGVVSVVSGSGSIISNCTIRENLKGFAIDCWNVASLTDPCALITDCRIINNNGGPNYSGGVFLSKGAKIRNSIIANNIGTNSSGGGVSAHWNAGVTSFVESCTIVSNYALSVGGVKEPAGAGSVCFITDTIIASNNAASGDKDIDVSDSNKNYVTNSCCPTKSLPSLQGNIQADPMFIDVNGGNYRLDRNSPCINAGLNQDWMTGMVDLDGHSRIDRFSGVVDMGAYERINSGTLYGFR